MLITERIKRQLGSCGIDVNKVDILRRNDKTHAVFLTINFDEKDDLVVYPELLARIAAENKSLNLAARKELNHYREFFGFFKQLVNDLK